MSKVKEASNAHGDDADIDVTIVKHEFVEEIDRDPDQNVFKEAHCSTVSTVKEEATGESTTALFVSDVKSSKFSILNSVLGEESPTSVNIVANKQFFGRHSSAHGTLNMSCTEQLINLVRKNRLLFDYGDPKHKDVGAKNKKWKELADMLHRDREQLKRQWKNLKDSYSRYLKSQRRLGQSSAKYQNWQWAKHMEFLRPFLAAADMSTSVCEDDSQITDDIHEHKHDEHVFPSNVTPPVSDNVDVSVGAFALDNERHFHDKRYARKIATRPRRDYSTPYDDNVIGFCGNRNVMDAVDHLFLSWAQTVKAFTPRRLLKTKMQISSIILREEQAQLEEDLTHQPLSVNTSPSCSATSPAVDASPQGQGAMPEESEDDVNETERTVHAFHQFS